MWFVVQRPEPEPTVSLAARVVVVPSPKAIVQVCVSLLPASVKLAVKVMEAPATYVPLFIGCAIEATGFALVTVTVELAVADVSPWLSVAVAETEVEFGPLARKAAENVHLKLPPVFA